MEGVHVGCPGQLVGYVHDWGLLEVYISRKWHQHYWCIVYHNPARQICFDLWMHSCKSCKYKSYFQSKRNLMVFLEENLSFPFLTTFRNKSTIYYIPKPTIFWSWTSPRIVCTYLFVKVDLVVEKQLDQGDHIILSYLVILTIRSFPPPDKRST